MLRSAALRVAIRAARLAREIALSNLVRELGHAVADSSDADVVLADADAGLFDGAAAVVLGGTRLDSGGLLPADASPVQIDAALRAVAAGLVVRARSDRGFSALEENEYPSPLTPREIEILIALSDGLSNKAIARRFDISQHTVKFHAESIFRKLGVATRAEAVARGLRRGLVHL